MSGPEQSNRILLILDRCGPGEAVRSLPMARAVRAADPTAYITLLVAEQAYPLFAGDRHFDRVVKSRLYGRQPRRGLRAVVTTCILLVRIGFRFDLVLTFLWGSSMLNLIGWLVGGTRRVGYPHRFPNLLTSNLGAYGTQGDMAANVLLMQAAGIPFHEPRGRALIVSEQERADSDRLLARLGRRTQRPLVVVHTGSDWACQQWTPEGWASLADQVIGEYEVDVAFTGLVEDGDYIEEVRRSMVSESISLVGETDLRQLAAVISVARLCVSVDSVAYDIAQALGVPTLVLAGPTQPEAPIGRTLTVINQTPPDLQKSILSCQGRFPNGFCHDYTCPWAGLKNISVERVLERIGLTGALTRTEAPTPNL
jgi:ADP-heptose:LPS heptosyltransferase